VTAEGLQAPNKRSESSALIILINEGKGYRRTAQGKPCEGKLHALLIEKRQMKILALEKEVPGVTEEQCTPYLQKEAGRAWELYQQGKIRELYFRADRAEAVLVLECKNIQEAASVINSLPLVSNGLIAFDLISLAPYPGFARLFK
jgi:hypothetical protein